jgi:hypothetical protein
MQAQQGENNVESVSALDKIMISLLLSKVKPRLGGDSPPCVGASG